MLRDTDKLNDLLTDINYLQKCEQMLTDILRHYDHHQTGDFNFPTDAAWKRRAKTMLDKTHPRERLRLKVENFVMENMG